MRGRHQRSCGKLREEVPNGNPPVVHPVAPNDLAFGVDDGEEGKRLVVVATDFIIRPATPPGSTDGELLRPCVAWVRPLPSRSSKLTGDACGRRASSARVSPSLWNSPWGVHSAGCRMKLIVDAEAHPTWGRIFAAGPGTVWPPSPLTYTSRTRCLTGAGCVLVCMQLLANDW